MWAFINMYTFERLVREDNSFVKPGTNKRMTYEDFMVWNNNCLDEKSPEYIDWLKTLLKMINDDQINLMDEESCVSFTASNIYFDMQKKLCIVNPR